MIKLILFILLTTPLLLKDPQLYSFIMVGAFPGMTALMVYRGVEKTKGMTIAFFNLTGILRYIFPMVERLGNNKFPDTMNMMNIFVVYSFAAIGYFVVWLVPRLFVIYADYKSQNRARIISEKMAALTEEWGPEIRH